jgi:hypothetical protein
VKNLGAEHGYTYQHFKNSLWLTLECFRSVSGINVFTNRMGRYLTKMLKVGNKWYGKSKDRYKRSVKMKRMKKSKMFQRCWLE